MSEQQFALDKLYYSIMTPIEKISVGRNYITYGEVVDLLNDQQATINKLKEENEQLKKQNKVTSEFFVVRENDKIIALFTSEQRAKFYCRENLANLHYQKEEWIIKERVVRFDE